MRTNVFFRSQFFFHLLVVISPQISKEHKNRGNKFQKKKGNNSKFPRNDTWATAKKNPCAGRPPRPDPFHHAASSSLEKGSPTKKSQDQTFFIYKATRVMFQWTMPRCRCNTLPAFFADVWWGSCVFYNTKNWIFVDAKTTKVSHDKKSQLLNLEN